MIELEHTLIMLLLLINLLRTRQGIHPSLRWLVVGVILLAFIAPSIPLALPWDLFAALFIPVLLWQSAQRLGNASWFGGGRDFIVWFVLTLGITAIIYLTGGLPLTSALLFGLLAASFVWNTVNLEKKETLLGQIGVLTLVFLLTGMEAAIEAPGNFLLALLAGGGIGIVVGFLAVLAAGRLNAGMTRELLSIGQVYLAYLIAWVVGMSAVAAAVVSIAVLVGFGIRRGLWSDGQIYPKPFRNTLVFAFGVAALAFFGWQTHIPFSFTVILEVVLVLILTAVIFMLGRRGSNPVIGIYDSLPETLFRVGSLLAAALLLWPRSMLIDPLPLVVALVFASVTALTVSLLLAPMLQLLSWLEENRIQTTTESSIPLVQVKELMRTEFLTFTPDTPVEEIPPALADQPSRSALVLDPSGRLAGVITEADLFVKQEKVPRTDVTYLVLFQNPVEPEYILQAYSSMRGQYRAEDIMTKRVVTIGARQPVGSAIQLFVTHGFKMIPVVDDNGEDGRVVGVLTRADLIRRFLAHAETEEAPPL